MQTFSKRFIALMMIAAFLMNKGKSQLKFIDQKMYS